MPKHNSATSGGQVQCIGGLTNKPEKGERRHLKQNLIQIMGFRIEDNGFWLRPVCKSEGSPITWRQIYRDGYPTNDDMEKVIRIATEIGSKENDYVGGNIVIPPWKLDRIFAEAEKDS
jgi:hypothetical protein